MPKEKGVANRRRALPFPFEYERRRRRRHRISPVGRLNVSVRCWRKVLSNSLLKSTIVCYTRPTDFQRSDEMQTSSLCGPLADASPPSKFPDCRHETRAGSSQLVFLERPFQEPIRYIDMPRGERNLSGAYTPCQHQRPWDSLFPPT